jgi:sugar O-acyltransferase (sialic acid O-acetyltransferase NeuD family)
LDKRKLVIIGNSGFAEVAYECFTCDSRYEVVAFLVDKPYLSNSLLLGVPVFDRCELLNKFPPSSHDVYVAITYGCQNRTRTKIVNEVKSHGYTLASYVSSRANIWRNVKIGQHCFILEENNIQPFVQIGSNVILWSGNHIGHHSSIEDNCFISSHVVISGYAKIGKNSFLGVNSTISNNVTLGEDNWVGPGVVIGKSTSTGKIFPALEANPSKVSTYRFFKIDE